MANIKIIDLPTGSPESTSFVEATQVDELAESGRSTVKLALNALGNYVAGQDASPLEYGDLETESTTLIGAANELHNTIGADAYDDTATYNTGDYCIYGGELYKCNDDNVTGAWDATKWDLTKVVDELGGGGGNADFVECTQAEYDAWEQGGTLDPDVMYFITDGQAGGGSLAGLSDVNLTNPSDGQLLRYNGTSGKWENAGIINDTTASASSVYSSNKTDTLLSGKADFSDISATVSFGSDINASGSFKWVVKIGKLVYIYANLQPKENWSGGNKILLSGLPVRAEYQELNYIPYTVGTQYFNSENNTIRGAAVNGSNQLQTQNSSNITTTNRIYINGFYRCQ